MIDVKQFSPALIAQDAIYFRYLADEADPSEFVRLCAGRTGLAVWREVIGAMMEGEK